MKWKPAASFILTLICILLLSTGLFANDFSNIPAKGMVTMLDLGAKKCIPCKMMAPIMEKMEKTYEGKAHVIFIDVWENRQPAQRFKVRAIPTQIFFNADGKEVYRHVGFLDEKSIINQMTKMSVKKPDQTVKDN